MRKTAVILTTMLAMVLGAVPALAHGDAGKPDDPQVREDLKELAGSFAKYRRVSRALQHGFVPFAIPEEVGGTLLTIGGADITCFDSPGAGMGVHYVRHIDDIIDPADPEALVYEVGRDGRLRLVAVEYIIPEQFVDPSDPPELFGHTMHHHPYLPVYIHHAWIWKRNPSGMFADFNPSVPSCPS